MMEFRTCTNPGNSNSFKYTKIGCDSTKEVNEFNYLGSTITKDGQNENDIKRTLA